MTSGLPSGFNFLRSLQTSHEPFPVAQVHTRQHEARKQFLYGVLLSVRPRATTLGEYDTYCFVGRAGVIARVSGTPMGKLRRFGLYHSKTSEGFQKSVAAWVGPRWLWRPLANDFPSAIQ